MLIGLLAMAIAAAPPQTGFEAYPARSESGHQCAIAKVRKLVGRTRNPTAEREALRLSGAGIVRWIRPGMMVTMDYRPDRLDLRIDGKGRIVSVNCG